MKHPNLEHLTIGDIIHYAFHSTLTFKNAFVGNGSQDLRAVNLTLYQLEQLSYVNVHNFWYQYPIMRAFIAYSVYSAYYAYNQ